MTDVEISEKTNINIKLVMLITVIISIVSATIVVVSAVSDNGSEHISMQEDIDDIKTIIIEHESRLDEQDVHYATIIEKLNNIEEKID